MPRQQNLFVRLPICFYVFMPSCGAHAPAVLEWRTRARFLEEMRLSAGRDQSII
jgi:hypothetical protein